MAVEKPDSLMLRTKEGAIVFRSDKTDELSFSFAVRDLEVWQKVLLSVAAVGGLAMCGFIAREFYYAVNPDKRPRKRKRRSQNDDEEFPK